MQVPSMGVRASTFSSFQCVRDQECSSVLDYCDDAVMVVPGLPEKEPDVLCNSFTLEQQVSHLHQY